MEVLWVSLLLIPCVMSTSICDSLLLQPASDTDPVRCMKTEPAVLGGNVTLTCTLFDPREVIQVTWCKRKGNETKVSASYSKEYGEHVDHEFSAFTSIVPLDPDENLNKSTIEISKLEKEDEACYGCYFTIKFADSVHGVICLTDIGISNEFTCSAAGTDISIIMNPPEIKTRKSERDIKGNLVLKGRYLDSNINPACFFFLQEEGGKKKLGEGPNEMVVFQCNATGSGTSQINWSKTGNPVGENKSTNGNVTIITSSLQIPRSSLSPDQNVSCSTDHATEGDPDNIAVKASGEWTWALLAVVLIAVAAAAVAAFYICKKHKRSSQNGEDKTSEDESQQKNTEGTPIKGCSENTDETPEKDFGGKKTEIDDLLNNANVYYPRKLQFE